MKLDPLNIRIMDVNNFIKTRGLQEVTSSFVHASSSNQFHPDGLFSETIFGPIASEERFKRHGYIKLNCRVFHPVAFQNLQSIKRFYVEIMAKRAYAIWDPEQADFIKAVEGDEGADTGYAFFLSHFNEIDFKKNRSLSRNDKINVLTKYKDKILIDKIIVIPAGIRDIKEEGDRVEKDSINSLYTSIMANAKNMLDGDDLDPICDNVHYTIQRKVLEVHDYLIDMFSGKTGFAEGKYGHRSIVNGTRNVITATSLESTDPSSPQYHKIDETKVPLFQCAKGFLPLVTHYIKTVFYSPIIGDTSDNVALIEPDTLKLTYVPIDPKDKDKLITSDGIMKTIDLFRDPEFRFKPVSATSTTDYGSKELYLYMLYDEGDKIYVFRDVVELKMTFERIGKPFDPSKVRPMSYAEMIYVATYVSSKGKYGTVTRYPVTDENSIYPAKTHLVTTAPSRIVQWVANIESEQSFELPEYPVLNGQFIDALTVHPSKLKGLQGDFDGDTVSWIPIYSREANEECEKYVNNISNFVMASGQPVTGCDDICNITMYALTAEPPKSGRQ